MVQNRAILITLRAAAIVIIATGLNDVIASALPRYEPLYLYLAGIVLVALLDGVIVGVLTALLSLGFYALLFMPRADLLTPRIVVPAVAMIATAVLAAVLRGVVRLSRRRGSPEVERVFPVAPPLIETSNVARVADNAEVLAAIDELRAELRAAVADLTATRDRAGELEELRRSQNAEREAVEARARQIENERDWALRELAEAREESATMAGRLAELELSSHESEKLRTRVSELEAALASAAPATELDEIRRALAETRNARDRDRAEVLAEKQRADALERTLADERAGRAAAEASLLEDRASRAATEKTLAEERAARASAEASLVESRASRAAAEKSLAEERTARAAAEKSLAEERAARAAAETSLAEERAARESAEASFVENRASRAATEKLLAEERASRAAAEKSLTDERAARAAAEQSLAEEQAARAKVETSLATEGTAHAQAKKALAEERAARELAEKSLAGERLAHAATEHALAGERALREAAAAEFDAKLQKIVNHLASDHEADLGQAVSEREEARAEARALRARLADLEKTAADERSGFDTRLQTIVTHLASDHEADLGQAMSEKEEARAEARALSMKLATVQRKLDDAEALLGETRTAAQGEIDRLRAQLGIGPAPPPTPPAAPAARPRVLVVHPDAAVRSGAAASLERAGYDVVSAADGLEALRVAIASQPEVVIAESSMPKMDGRELCQLLKSQEKTAHIRFILLMRATDEAPRGELPPDEVLRKPVPVETLRATLASLLAAPR